MLLNLLCYNGKDQTREATQKLMDFSPESPKQ